MPAAVPPVPPAILPLEALATTPALALENYLDQLVAAEISGAPEASAHAGVSASVELPKSPAVTHRPAGNGSLVVNTGETIPEAGQ